MHVPIWDHAGEKKLAREVRSVVRVSNSPSSPSVHSTPTDMKYALRHLRVLAGAMGVVLFYSLRSFLGEPVYVPYLSCPSLHLYAPRALKCVPPLPHGTSFSAARRHATGNTCVPLSIHPPDSRVGTSCACALGSCGMRDRRRPANAGRQTIIPEFLKSGENLTCSTLPPSPQPLSWHA